MKQDLRSLLSCLRCRSGLAQDPASRRKARALLSDAGDHRRALLELGELKAGEKMFDLGSGDGRIVIMAAQKYHADATGVELDNDLYKQSTAKIRKLGLEKTARIIHGDLLKQNYSSADLITVYLLPESNIKVRRCSTSS